MVMLQLKFEPGAMWIVFYFIGIEILFALLDMVGIFDATMFRLTESAYESWLVERQYRKDLQALMPIAIGVDAAEGEGAANEERSVDEEQQQVEARPTIVITKELKESLRSEAYNKIVSASTRPLSPPRPTFCKRLWWTLCDSSELGEDYEEEFLKDITQGDAYSGCRDVLCPGGLNIPLTSTRLSRGMVEDFVFFIANNNMLLGQFMSTRGVRYSRFNKRISYYAVCAVGFFASAIMIKNVPPDNQEIISALLIAPFELLVTSAIYLLLVCPCLSVRRYSKNSSSTRSTMSDVRASSSYTNDDFEADARQSNMSNLNAMAHILGITLVREEELEPSNNISKQQQQQNHQQQRPKVANNNHEEERSTAEICCYSCTLLVFCLGRTLAFFFLPVSFVLYVLSIGFAQDEIYQVFANYVLYVQFLTFVYNVVGNFKVTIVHLLGPPTWNPLTSSRARTHTHTHKQTLNGRCFVVARRFD